VKRSACLLAALVVLAGCAAVPSIDTTFDGLKGQPLTAAVSKLGPPTRQQTAAGETVAVWTDRVQDDTLVPTQKTTFDYGRASTVEVMARPEPPIFRTCTLSVHSDRAGMIVAVDRDGTSAACAPMARKIAG
jgi:hypothetical protein